MPQQQSRSQSGSGSSEKKIKKTTSEVVINFGNVENVIANHTASQSVQYLQMALEANGHFTPATDEDQNKIYPGIYDKATADGMKAFMEAHDIESPRDALVALGFTVI